MISRINLLTLLCSNGSFLLTLSVLPCNNTCTHTNTHVPYHSTETLTPPAKDVIWDSGMCAHVSVLVIEKLIVCTKGKENRK